MRKLILIICFLVIPSLSFAWTLPFSEDCESGVYPYGFDGEQETGSGVAGEYTGPNKNGAKAIQFDTGATANSRANVYIAGTAENELWMKMAFWFDSELLENNNLVVIARISDSTYRNIVSIRDVSDNYYFYGVHGSSTEDAASGAMALDTEYIIKIRYVYSTGTDGILQVWVKIPGGRYNDPVVDISDGTDTEGIAQGLFGLMYTQTNDNCVGQMDDFEIATTDPDPDTAAFGQIIIIN